MTRVLVVLFASAALAGCVTMTPRAQRIQLQQQDSALLKDCQKLGRVDAEASGYAQWTYDDLKQQAENNLREAAAARYVTADTVVVLNVDTRASAVGTSGVAFRCY